MGSIGPAEVTTIPPPRLLATVVDDVARECPARRVAVVPNGSDTSKGFREITFQDLSRAVNFMSWWIDEHLVNLPKGETIAYMGSHDLRYLILMLASHKTGYPLFLPSPRLSNEAYDHIFGKTRSTTLLFAEEKQRLVSELTGISKSMGTLQVPSIAEMLNASNVKHYDFTPTFEEMEDKIAFIIHSSGTTGMPKPVPSTHGFVGTLEYTAIMPRPAGRSLAHFCDLATTDPYPTDLALSVTPYFHLMGIMSLMEAVYHNITLLAIPDQPLSVSLLVDVIRKQHPTAAVLPPSIVEDMSQSAEGLDCLGTLKFVCFAGAPLAPEVGDKVNEYTSLRTTMGSSEMGILRSFVPEGKENWGYFEWDPEFRIDMQFVEDGMYELVVPRVENSRRMHGIFHTFPELKEYRSKDLFAQHPTNPNLWRYYGRLDDVIVLSNGEKLNPVSLEKIVEGHPSVHRALVIGQRRFQTCLLIQPTRDGGDKDIDEKAFVENIWPLVQSANETVPQYGHILKNMIRLSSPEKPFKLTPKGTTQRHFVNTDYAREIDAIYAAQDKELGVALPSTIDFENMQGFVCDILASVSGKSDVKPGDDFFSLGLDSLQAIQLSQRLRGSVLAHNPELKPECITVQDVYSRPTADKLASFLLDVLQGHEAAPPTESRATIVSNLVSKYTSDLPVRSPTSSDQLPELSTVILTGSTGSLGSYILSDLLTSPKVAKVYCFNRSDDAAARQHQGFIEKGLDADTLADTKKVEFLHVSFGEKHFGLDDSVYKTLLGSVDLIIHNAWKVNFNHQVSSFEDPHIKGLRELVNFSLDSRYNTHLAFVSSVSTIGAWAPTATESAVPEIPMESVDPVLEQGYGESKHVSERICAEASKRSGVPTSVLRVGQIAGPDSRLGQWNPHEWLPTIVKTSTAIGKVPADLGSIPVDWIAVDTLATITLEILLGRRSSLSSTRHAVFHLVNPTKAPWSSLVPAIQERYKVTPVPFTEWIDELEQIQDPSTEEVAAKPGLKLLPFYRASTVEGGVLGADMSVERSKEASETMASLGPVSGAQMANWLQQWGF